MSVQLLEGFKISLLTASFLCYASSPVLSDVVDVGWLSLCSSSQCSEDVCAGSQALTTLLWGLGLSSHIWKAAATVCLQITLLRTPGEQLNSFAFFGLGHRLSKAIFSCCSRALWLKLVFTWYNDTFVAGFLSLHIHMLTKTCLTLQAKLYNLLLVLMVGVTLNLQKVPWCKFS